MIISLIKFYEYFSNLIPFFLFLNCEYLDSLKIEESKKKESSGFFVDILDIFWTNGMNANRNANFSSSILVFIIYLWIFLLILIYKKDKQLGNEV